MPFQKKFELKLYVPATWEVSGDMPDRWANGLKNNAEIINDRRQEKVPDDGTFINKMATPASKGYAPYVPSGYISKRGRAAESIRGSHTENLKDAFERWNTNLNRVFATVDGVVAKVFKEKVDNAKDRWAIKVGDKVLWFTGDRIRGRSVTPIAAFYLVGDERAQGWVRESDLVDGAPYSIASDREANALKAAIQQRLVQGGQLIVNCEYHPDAIAAENAVNASLLSKLRDTTKADAFVAAPTADKCFCSWVLDPTGLFYLHIQVGITV